MAALRSPLAPSPTPGQAPAQDPDAATMSPTSHSDALSPKSTGSLAPPSPYPQFLDPSPTESSGTDTTDIDDEAQDDVHAADMHDGARPSREHSTPPPAGHVASPTSPIDLARLDTSMTAPVEATSDDAPASVIHVSEGFRQFSNTRSSSSSAVGQPTSKPVLGHWIASPSTPDAAQGPDDKSFGKQEVGLNNSTETVTKTPQRPPSERQDSVTDKSVSPPGPARHIPTSGASDIDIQVINVDGDLAYKDTMHNLEQVSEEIRGLRRALSNCWNLCNTLADLSTGYRASAFAASGCDPLQHTAWNSCWQLCQELYEHRHDPDANVAYALGLCREFAKARFQVRARRDPATDSILRVTFELSTHMYNLRDRNLSDDVLKRTMTFYITLCHRMMKQRSVLPTETDNLLCACWNLAASLYNLQRGNASPDPFTSHLDEASEEELLTSALHAAFALSDLLKNNWSSSRSDRAASRASERDRGTPRPNQSQFRSSRTNTSEGRDSSLSNRTYHNAPSHDSYGSKPSYTHSAAILNAAPPLPPETPVTIFDDITDSSSPESATAPNILVLGTNGPRSSSQSSSMHPRHHDRWSSNASTLSDHSNPVSATSHVPKTPQQAEQENRHLHLVRGLIFKAALNVGFDPVPTRPPPPPLPPSSSSASASTAAPGNPPSLRGFVKGLGPTAFGEGEDRRQLLSLYKELVRGDRSLEGIEVRRGEVSSWEEVRDAVAWLVACEQGQWRWVRALWAFVTRKPLDQKVDGEMRLA